MKKCFLFRAKSSFRSWDNYIFVMIFRLLKKNQFDQNGKINFRIYDFTDWITNNYKTDIAQYPKKQR